MMGTRALSLAVLGVLVWRGGAGAPGLDDDFLRYRLFPVVDGAGQPVIDCPGCLPGTNGYELGGWQDALALIYAGIPHTGTTTGDCAGAVRRSLVKSWGNLQRGTCSTD